MLIVIRYYADSFYPFMCMVLLVIVQQLLDMLYTCYDKFLNYKFYLWINHWAIISCRTILQFGFGVDN